MTVSWEDVEDAKVISHWRKEKMSFTTPDGNLIRISRRALCIIINALSDAAYEPKDETYDTEFVPGKGWVPPLEIWRKERERARKRSEDEIINIYSRKGHTLKERREFRHECREASKQLDAAFDMCPREMCPMEHCSYHC